VSDVFSASAVTAEKAPKHPKGITAVSRMMGSILRVFMGSTSYGRFCTLISIVVTTVHMVYRGAQKMNFTNTTPRVPLCSSWRYLQSC
jgi:hypothetical protein